MHPLATSIAVALALLAASAAHAADLYREGDYRPLTADARAFRLGDSLTVLVLETSSAASSADTSAKRRTEAGLGAVLETTPRTQRADLSLNASNNFDGVARTQRAGKLLAQITVTVVGVEPNGDLRIAGDQLLDINDEQQKIKLEGRVRRQDINENNAVVSNRIADARIFYSGEGVLADGQRPGVITKVLRWLGL